MEIEDDRLTAFGQAVRERRKARRLPLRELAAQAGISASYLSSIECARNPTTGRPPQISAGVAERLCRLLGLDSIPPPAGAGHQHGDGGCDHVLLYRLDRRRDGLGAVAKRMFGDRVGEWLCIEDPSVKASDADGFHSWNWPFRSEPYPDETLRGERIVAALEREAERLKGAVGDAEYGVIIADCSAVMRWVANPDAEVDFEEDWSAAAGSALARVFGQEPAANVCVYHQMDLEAMSGRIDVLDILLRLLRHHDRVIAVSPSGELRHGAEAIGLILEENRPSSVSAKAWRTVSAALARTHPYVN